MTRIAVVILNFNGEALLRKFLPSVVRNSPEAEIVVVDNGSSDQSVPMLGKEFPGIKVIGLPENFGFCGGYNRGLRQVDADLFVLLNSDVEVTEGWLLPLRDLLDRDPAIGAAQPKILSYREKNRFEYAGAAGGFIDVLGYPFCRGRIFGHVETDRGQYDDEKQIFWASGACMMVRAGVFRKFGGLDEELFAHMEEIDLCWKMQRANIEVWYSGKSTVYHLGAGTLGYEDPVKTYLNFRNGLILIFKHLDTAELIFKFPFRIALDWMAAAGFLIRGRGNSFSAVLRAHLHFFGDIRRQLKKRRALRAAYPTYSRGNIHPGLIIFDYFLRKRRTYPLNNPR